MRCGRWEPGYKGTGWIANDTETRKSGWNYLNIQTSYFCRALELEFKLKLASSRVSALRYPTYIVDVKPISTLLSRDGADGGSESAGTDGRVWRGRQGRPCAALIMLSTEPCVGC